MTIPDIQYWNTSMQVYGSQFKTRLNTNSMRYLPKSHQSRGFPCKNRYRAVNNLTLKGSTQHPGIPFGSIASNVTRAGPVGKRTRETHCPSQTPKTLCNNITPLFRNCICKICMLILYNTAFTFTKTHGVFVSFFFFF